MHHFRRFAVITVRITVDVVELFSEFVLGVSNLLLELLFAIVYVYGLPTGFCSGLNLCVKYVSIGYVGVFQILQDGLVFNFLRIGICEFRIGFRSSTRACSFFLRPL